MYGSAPANEALQDVMKFNPEGSATQVSCRTGRWDKKSEWFVGVSAFRAEEKQSLFHVLQ